MPELPEVETMRRGILPCLGATISDIHFFTLPLKPIQVTPSVRQVRRRVAGSVVTSVDRLGKRILLELDARQVLVFEPRMTGMLSVENVPSQEHLRVRIDLAGGDLDRIYFWDRRGLGTVQLMRLDELAVRLGPDRIGPDALLIECDELRQRLRRSRRAIKVALLDQKVVAGIGNIYASEILHLAHVHPAARCDLLGRLQWERIHQAMGEILEEAIKHEGSTLSDGSYRNALNNPGSYQARHQVYDRDGQACLRCEEHQVLRIVQAQRSTFYCPGCQPRRTWKETDGLQLAVAAR
ncbi:MAG: bifunctional DNA-formamidopyrimidine glycosylase/DNA-(apurinic or apyrimidinic site) lyase [Pirellulaceae bacterium]